MIYRVMLRGPDGIESMFVEADGIIQAIQKVEDEGLTVVSAFEETNTFIK